MTTAKEVPALVAAHQEALRGVDYHLYTKSFFDSVSSKHIGMQDMTKWVNASEEAQWNTARNWCNDHADMLNLANLYHVTESMTEVSKIAAMTLPKNEKWGPDILPYRCGVLVFEKPVQLLDVWNRIVTIAAVIWYRVDGGVSFTEYTDITTAEDHYNQLMSHQGTLSGKMGRWSICHVERFVDGSVLAPWLSAKDMTDYTMQTEVSDAWPKDFTPKTVAFPGETPVFGNISNVCFAIFALMEQSIAVLSEETDKRLARRNRNKKRPLPMVVVIKLRRESKHGYREPGTGTWLNYRTIVSGHWKRQHYGPGGENVKRIYVNDYPRGDPDLPLWIPQRVHTLSR